MMNEAAVYDPTRAAGAQRSRQTTFERGVALALATGMLRDLRQMRTLVEGLRWIVNGVPTVDPQNNNVIRDGLRVDNLLLVPGAESALYQNRDVPHGTLAATWYDSPSLKLKRRMHPGHADLMQPPAAGSDVYHSGQAEPVGTVVMSAMAPGGGVDLLFELPVDRLGSPAGRPHV